MGAPPHESAVSFLKKTAQLGNGRRGSKSMTAITKEGKAAERREKARLRSERARRARGILPRSQQSYWFCISHPQFCATRGITPAFQVNQVHDARPLQRQALKDVSGRHRMVSANFRVHSLDPSSDIPNFLPGMG
jgi:hypothetical protein